MSGIHCGGCREQLDDESVVYVEECRLCGACADHRLHKKLICPGCGGEIISEHPGFSKHSPETLLCEPCLKAEDWKKEDWLETEASELMVEALECYASVMSHCGDNPEQKKKNRRMSEIARLIREA